MRTPGEVNHGFPQIERSHPWSFRAYLTRDLSVLARRPPHRCLASSLGQAEAEITQYAGKSSPQLITKPAAASTHFEGSSSVLAFEDLEVIRGHQPSAPGNAMRCSRDAAGASTSLIEIRAEGVVNAWVILALLLIANLSDPMKSASHSLICRSSGGQESKDERNSIASCPSRSIARISPGSPNPASRRYGQSVGASNEAHSTHLPSSHGTRSLSAIAVHELSSNEPRPKRSRI